jgi:hypothetical protein
VVACVRTLACAGNPEKRRKMATVVEAQVALKIELITLGSFVRRGTI